MKKIGKRRKVLNDFYKKLLQENIKPRKRKTKKAKVFSELSIGDVIMYKSKEEMRYVILLDICKSDLTLSPEYHSFYMIGFLLDYKGPKSINNKIGTITLFDAFEFIPKKLLK